MERPPAPVPRFDPGRFSADAERSWTLPSDWYVAPDVYAAERTAIFDSNWIYQCHRSQVAQPGDSHAGAIAGRPVIVARDADGTLHATEPGGNGAPAAALRLEEFGGLLFVNRDPHAAPLSAQAGKLLADMRATCPRMDELVFAYRHETTVAANWKTVIDNNHECYHCATNHPTLMELVGYEGKARWSDDGITFSHAVEVNSLENGAYTLAADGLAQQALFGFVWPTLIPLMFPGSTSLILFQVIPAGVETTVERWDFLFLDPTPNDQERRLIDYIRNALIPEDTRLCERVQNGLHSRGYRQGRFVVARDHPEFSEHHVHFFQKMVHDALMG